MSAEAGPVQQVGVGHGRDDPDAIGYPQAVDELLQLLWHPSRTLAHQHDDGPGFQEGCGQHQPVQLTIGLDIALVEREAHVGGQVQMLAQAIAPADLPVGGNVANDGDLRVGKGRYRSPARRVARR